MCLAVPGKIKKISGSTAEVDYGGVVKEASLLLVPQARPGDYVLVHAGFAIQLLDKKDARGTLKVFKDLYGGHFPA